MTFHQQQQVQVINQIEQSILQNSLNFSTVAPVDDFENDSRICLTSLHFPNQKLINDVQKIIYELKKVEPNFYYYPPQSLHLTIKNIRVINDPPNFNQSDVEKAQQIFREVIPKHQKFKVYFYRLLLFPNNLALVGTTDPELDEIVLDLDEKLNKVGVPDDKKYNNERYFFSNMTLARFGGLSSRFASKVKELSAKINFKPYEIDSVTLISGNAVFKNPKIIQRYNLL